jgi:RND family efflux transporter MFP subunit
MNSRSFLFVLAFVIAPFAGAEELVVPEADGIMLPRHRVNLSIAVEARLRELYVAEGQRVKRGDALAILYTEAEELDTSRAEAQLKKADFLFKSKTRLKETKSLAEVEMIGAEVDLELAKIERERAQAILRDKTLAAPWEGIVLRVLKSAGETVNRGEKVIELIDYSTIYVDVYLDAKYLAAVKPGQEARVSGEAIGREPVAATVAMVDPVVEPGSGLSRVRLQMSNADLRIPTGLPVKVRFGPAALAQK